MSSMVGTTLRVTLFGQSHSQAVGAVCEGLPAGIKIDQERLAAFMARRAPGKNAWSTPRKEADAVEFVAGLNPEGITCGTPLALMIANTNTHSQDYANLVDIPRPGHADWVANVKWGGNQDVSGGGHFSARLTAPLCAIGAICMQVLEEREVRIGAHLASIATVCDEPFAAGTSSEERTKLDAQLDALADGRDFPAIDELASASMQQAIADARSDDDSVGGIVECVIAGLPTGIGSPMFDGMENLIARAAFGIPAVKGIEFGCGFEATRMRGSEHNDPYGIQDGNVTPLTNNAGGILGGITSGAPVVFRLAMKPTSSIGIEQDSVDLRLNKPAKLVVKGRHDPCIAPRAVPVAEAVAAICALDAWMSFPPESYLANHE